MDQQNNDLSTGPALNYSKIHWIVVPGVVKLLLVTRCNGYLIVTPPKGRMYGWISPLHHLLLYKSSPKRILSLRSSCVWWSFEGIIKRFELVQNGAVSRTVLYSGQLDRVYATLSARRYPAALIGRKPAFLQHYNAPPAHTAALIKSNQISSKIKELLPAIEFLPHATYRPNFALPLDD